MFLIEFTQLAISKFKMATILHAKIGFSHNIEFSLQI